MFTKSRIQSIQETLRNKELFLEGLNNLMYKYIVEDSVFMYVNDSVMEVTRGYFEKKDSYDNLKEAIQNIKTLNESIRIINNKEFQIGIVKLSITECSKDTSVFDIEKLTNVR